MTVFYVYGRGFEAARKLTQGATTYLTRPHGHSFHIEVSSRRFSPMELAARLGAVIQPLDYQSLNYFLPEPSDINLVQWLHDAIGSCSLHLRSAPDRGAEITEYGMTKIWLRAQFSAAHRLPRVAANHQCGRLHGHTFAIKLTAHADKQTHFSLEQAWLRIRPELHHRHLNQIAGLENPTSEMIAAWLWRRLAQVEGLLNVTVHETATAGSRFDGHEFCIWKEQRFEAAIPFDSHGRYTGNSYRVLLYLSGELDDVMGWVEDFGDVKARFTPIYNQLDHHQLDHLPGISTYDTAAIADWILLKAARELPMLHRVDLYTDSNYGVRLYRSRM